ncbi:hypothetical protein OIU84_028041 [Salix udensis]|uniref:Uncharacterized protein n=1 Tax=Salix udensis TaxID=889485 RepID=A0AAD6P9P4_9ROSI|nr:hypothetical protein OIU84_028041 [Salix udensis]
MSCKNTVDSPLYVDTTHNYRPVNYSNSSLMTYSNYVTDGGMTVSDLMELCSIEKIFLLPEKNYTDKSFEEMHNDLAYGFELSWYNFYCGECRSGCYLDSTDRRQCNIRMWHLMIKCSDLFSFAFTVSYTLRTRFLN